MVFSLASPKKEQCLEQSCPRESAAIEPAHTEQHVNCLYHQVLTPLTLSLSTGLCTKSVDNFLLDYACILQKLQACLL